MKVAMIYTGILGLKYLSIMQEYRWPLSYLCSPTQQTLCNELRSMWPYIFHHTKGKKKKFCIFIKLIDIEGCGHSVIWNREYMAMSSGDAAFPVLFLLYYQPIKTHCNASDSGISSNIYIPNKILMSGPIKYHTT